TTGGPAALYTITQIMPRPQGGGSPGSGGRRCASAGRGVNCSGGQRMEELNQKKPAQPKRARQGGQTRRPPAAHTAETETKTAKPPRRQPARAAAPKAPRAPKTGEAPAANRRAARPAQPRLPQAPRLPRRRQSAPVYTDPAVPMHICPLGGLGEVGKNI